jgi:hypothetical protein
MYFTTTGPPATRPVPGSCATKHRKIDGRTSFAIADRTAAEAWIAHFDTLDVRHSGIRAATRGWVVDVYDPDRLTVRLYSTGDDAENHTNRVRPRRLGSPRRAGVGGLAF